MNMKIVVLLSIVVIIISGCSYNEGVIQKDDVAYLKLTGNLYNITLQIGDEAITEILDSSKNSIYEIKPGTHTITVRRDSQIIVKRKIYFDNQIIREVNIK